MSAVGIPKSELDTPALWVDLDLMEDNVRKLASYFRRAGIGWRPHTKGIKVPAIAHMLLQAGALGVTCAKVSEAEVLTQAGIRDILIANQVVGRPKIARLVHLRRHADVMVAVDSSENAVEISSAAQQIGLPIRTLIELDCGMRRAGVSPGEPAAVLATHVASLPGLRLAGLMSWEGHVFRIMDPARREAEIRSSVQRLVDTAELCRDRGLDIGIVSCGGSVSYQTASHVPGVTESQTGGAIFADVAYRARGVQLSPSLFVQATVTSRPSPDRAVVDAGRKSMDGEVAMPVVQDSPGVTLISLTAEHGVLTVDPDSPLRIGDKLDFGVGYGDFTVCLHETLFGVRSGIVETAWPILGRGKLT